MGTGQCEFSSALTGARNILTAHYVDDETRRPTHSEGGGAGRVPNSAIDRGGRMKNEMAKIGAKEATM